MKITKTQYLSLIFQRTQIATYAGGQKLRGLRAEDAPKDLFREQKKSVSS